MTIHQLMVFCTVVQNGGFTKAAQHLLISQPSVSAEVNTLEKKIGVTLIDRGRSRKNKVILTEAGEKVYDLANEILRNMAELERYTSQFNYAKTSPSIVTIIANSPAGTYLLPELLNEFNKINPDFRIDVFIGMNYVSIVEAVERGLYDIAIFPEPPNHFASEFVFREHLTVVANKQYYNRKTKYRLEDLPLILPPEETPVRRILDRLFTKKGIRPNVMLNLSHPDSIKNTVMLGKGVAILSVVCVKEDVKKNGVLIELQITDELPVLTYSVIRPSIKSTSKPVQQVLEFFQQKLT